MKTLLSVLPLLLIFVGSCKRPSESAPAGITFGWDPRHVTYEQKFEMKMDPAGRGKPAVLELSMQITESISNGKLEGKLNTTIKQYGGYTPEELKPDKNVKATIARYRSISPLDFRVQGLGNIQVELAVPEWRVNKSAPPPLYADSKGKLYVKHVNYSGIEPGQVNKLGEPSVEFKASNGEKFGSFAEAKFKMAQEIQQSKLKMNWRGGAEVDFGKPVKAEVSSTKTSVEIERGRPIEPGTRGERVTAERPGSKVGAEKIRNISKIVEEARAKEKLRERSKARR